MRGRGPIAALAASPTMVGAVTTLIVIVAVFLAYNANQGLPFVPVYRVSVEVPNAARMGVNNEVRIGGTRVGVVESIEPVRNETASETAQADGAAAGVPPVAAQVNLKLDETARPLPQDSVFRVRYRSSFGLKYLEVVRGTGEGAPEGFTFNGLNDGTGDPTFTCELPVDPETFSERIPEQAKDGCFQPQTEFDAISNTFDTETRENARRNLLGYGNAFAARGQSLNQAVQGLRPLLVNLRPVARILADPSTGLRRLFAEMADTARIVAPVSDIQAQLFTNGAAAFAAIARDPEALQATISEGPATLQTVIETSPRLRPFLAEFAELSRRLRPGVRDLRLALPVLNSAIQTGAPVLNRSVGMNRRLRGALVELRRLIDQPSTQVTLDRLDETFDEGEPLLRYAVPAQTVCNYFNYWFTFLPEALSDRDQVGYNFRQALTEAPLGELEVGVGPVHVQIPGMAEGPMGGYSGIQANGIAGPVPNPLDAGVFKPTELPILHGNPFAPTGQDGDDCQPGQTGYFLGHLPVPGQELSNPSVIVSDFPGSRGPTTVFFNDQGEREWRDTRVEARQP